MGAFSTAGVKPYRAARKREAMGHGLDPAGLTHFLPTPGGGIGIGVGIGIECPFRSGTENLIYCDVTPCLGFFTALRPD
jgi:hypothetical protein